MKLDRNRDRLFWPSDVNAGIGAMQRDRATIVIDINVANPQVHGESPEIFCFFNYEFRVGHGIGQMTDNLWSPRKVVLEDFEKVMVYSSCAKHCYAL